MEFTAPLATFLKPLQNICSVAGTSANSDDITQNILLSLKDGMLTFRGTDYRIELSYCVAVESREEGTVLVNAAKMREACSKLSMQSLVSMHTEGPAEGELIVQSGPTVFQMRTRAADDFPSFPVEDVQQTVSIKQKYLKNIIARSIFCISQEEFREYLRGMRMEFDQQKLTVFTSDGHRMAIVDSQVNTPLSDFYGVTLIRPGAAQLDKILEPVEDDIEISFCKNMFHTQCNGYTLKSKLLVCGYPNVRGVIPKEVRWQAPVNRAQLRQEIARVAVLSSRRINGVNMMFSDGVLNLRSENSEHEVATSEMPIDYHDDQIDITLNASYVAEVLSAIPTEEVYFNFSQPLINVMIEPKDEPEDSGVKTRYLISRVVV